MNAANTLSDVDYDTNVHRKSGVESGIASKKMHNKLYRQISIMTVALANFIASEGYDALDQDVNDLSNNLSKALDKISRVPLDKHRENRILDHPDGSVTTEKLANNSVNRSKLNSDIITWLNNTFINASGDSMSGDLSIPRGISILFKSPEGTTKAGIRLGNNGKFDVGFSYDEDTNMTTEQLYLHSYLTPKWYNSNQGGVNLATEIYVWEAFKKVYPVGSIYISLNSTSPSTLFGFGRWEALPQGRMLLSQGNEYAAGSTGGEKEHTLTIAEMPSHSHGYNTGNSGAHNHSGTTSLNGDHNHGSGNANRYADAIFNGRYGSSTAYGTESGRENNVIQNATTTNGSHNHTFMTSNVGAHSHSINLDGGGQAHNNMPPYLAVYMWKRVS